LQSGFSGPGCYSGLTWIPPFFHAPQEGLDIKHKYCAHNKLSLAFIFPREFHLPSSKHLCPIEKASALANNRLVHCVLELNAIYAQHKKPFADHNNRPFGAS
jgi:hypothetical protein